MGGTVGERLAELRRARRWTQPEVAERLGLTRVTVSNHERAGTMPDEPTLARYAALYGVGVDELRYGPRVVNGTQTAPGAVSGPGAGSGLSDYARGVLHAAHRMSATVTALIEEVMGAPELRPTAPIYSATADMLTDANRPSPAEQERASENRKQNGR